MIDYPKSVSSPVQINKSEKPETVKNKININPENPQKADQTELNTEEKLEVGKYKKGSSPSNLSFDDQLKAKEAINPMAVLALTIASLIGSLAGEGSYNPELFDALSRQLEKASSVFNRDGTAADMDPFGNLRVNRPEPEKLEV